MAKVKLGNVKGSKGDKGDRGSLWRVSDKMTGQSTSGTAFPGAGFEDSVVNDICLNPATFDLYRCQTAGNAAAAKWVWECNIKGPQGPQGPQGEPTTVDAVLSKDSVNPIQNKAVATKFQDVQDSLDRKADVHDATMGRIEASAGENQPVGVRVISSMGEFCLIGSLTGISMWNQTENRVEWAIKAK